MGSRCALIRRRRRVLNGRTAVRVASCPRREKQAEHADWGGVPSGLLCPQGTGHCAPSSERPLRWSHPLGPLLLGTPWPVWLLALPEPLPGGVAWNPQTPTLADIVDISCFGPHSNILFSCVWADFLYLFPLCTILVICQPWGLPITFTGATHHLFLGTTKVLSWW